MRVLAGKEQEHTVQNAFNVLVNQGFLRDQQGVHSLEVVQEFFRIINRKPGKASPKFMNLASFCRVRAHTLKNHAAIILVKEDSQTYEKVNHVVRVSREPTCLKAFRFLGTKWTPKIKLP